ncbi:MAG: crossover junction endodeoxyribonuclease RuvC [Candidatus Binatia bacterium]
MGVRLSRDCRAEPSSNSKSEKILGIDPGTVATGWGFIEMARGSPTSLAHGTIRSSSRDRQEVRLGRVYRGLTDIIARYQPHAISLEKIFFARDPQSALKLGQVRGIALLAAVENQVTVYEYSSAEIKKAAVGYGNASKEQVEKMVRALLQVPERVARDAADALAAALCHFHQQSFHLRVRVALHAAERRLG